MKLLNQSKNDKEIALVIPAFGFIQRLLGLLPYSEMPAGHVMWLSPCNNVHTCLMRFSIDVVFVDKDLKVKSICEELTPYKFKWQRDAHSAFEMSAGAAREAGIEVGDQLHVVN